MRARKVDANLGNLLVAAREMGFRIFVRNDALGDADAQLCGVSEIWEVKDKKGRFTDLQKRMRDAGWIIRTIRSVEDLMQARAEMMKAGAAIQKLRTTESGTR